MKIRTLGASLAVAAAALLAAGCEASVTNTLPNEMGCSNCKPPSGGNDGGPGTPGTPAPGSDAGPPGMSDAGPPPMMMNQNATWSDGMALSAPVIISAGVTITIAPGAKITCAPATSITVKGTLTGTSMTTHAALSGVGWGG
ncbi:MAG TPA: hypothetical protein VH137_06780, partial [Gemmatimonadales bacterium]|nr:hypothetical protein [Gemmatimonadales bacterium]